MLSLIFFTEPRARGHLIAASDNHHSSLGRSVNTVARLTKPNRGISVEVSKAIKDHWGRITPVVAGKAPSLRICFTLYEHTIY